jgi:hypothetical protein
MTFQVFFHMFLQMLQKHVSSVLFAFRRMLQMFYLDILKVDRGVAMTPMASAQQPAARLRLLPRAFLARRASPFALLFSPPLSSLPFPPLHLAMAWWGTLPDEATSA